MSLSKTVAGLQINRFIIPCAGKMFKSDIPNRDKALCFVLNKGYFETQDLLSMLGIKDVFSNRFGFVFVGNIEKIKLSSGKIVYRQRLFFKNLVLLINLCNQFGVYLFITKDFEISIDNLTNCTGDLRNLECIARRHGNSLGMWLTNCCKIELSYLLRKLGMSCDIDKRILQSIGARRDYLYRSPLLVSQYNIDTHGSGIFLDYGVDDVRLCSTPTKGVGWLSIAYTDKNIKSDIKRGLL